MMQKIIFQRLAAQILVIIFLLSLVTWTSSAGLWLSPVTNGLYVALTSLPQSEASKESWATNQYSIDWKEPLALLIFSQTGSVHVAYPQQNKFFIRFEMVDTKSESVSKTAVGRAWGADFGRVPKDLGQKTSVSQFAVPLFVTSSHTNSKSVSRGPSLPAPKDLFVIKKKGIYKLKVEVFLLRAETAADGKIRRWQPVRFPTVDVSVDCTTEILH